MYNQRIKTIALLCALSFITPIGVSRAPLVHMAFLSRKRNSGKCHLKIDDCSQNLKSNGLTVHLKENHGFNNLVYHSI